MSYSIIYDSLAVRLPKSNKYLPLVLMGCSNVYECGRGTKDRRARDWQFWSPGGTRKVHTKESLLQSVEEVRQSCIRSNEETLKRWPDWSRYNDKSFGYFAGLAVRSSTHKTTYNMFRNIFINPLDRAIDIDDFLKHHSISVEIPYYSIPTEERDTMNPVVKYIGSEDELLAAIEEFNLNYSQYSFYIRTSINNRTSSKDVYRRVAPQLLPQRTTRQKTQVEQDHYYTIKFEGCYFVKKTSRSIRYNYYRPVVKYRTEREVQRRLKSLDDPRFSIERINQPNIFLV